MMKQFRLVPELVLLDTCEEFVKKLVIGDGDLIITNEYTYSKYFNGLVKDATVIYIGNYGQGEPSDEMVEAIYRDIKDVNYKRVVAIGGGTVIDVAKLFVLAAVSPVSDLFDHTVPAVTTRSCLFFLPPAAQAVK